MSKIIIEIDPELQDKQLFAFLKANKKQLLAQKKMDVKHACAFSYSPSYSIPDSTGFKAVGGEQIPEDADILRVDVVANTSMWCDTYMDVLLKGSASKSMKERKGNIPHIHDHDWTVGAEIGEVVSISYKDIPLRELGLKQEGTGQALVFETDVMRSYNSVVFEKYRTKKIKQHSIGLRYVQIDLAINEPDDEYYKDEYKLWKKHIDQIINKEYVESKGYFFPIAEYILLENSCVLFGANILTPTLSTSQKSDTVDQPDEHATDEQPFNLDEAIKQTKFIF